MNELRYYKVFVTESLNEDFNDKQLQIKDGFATNKPISKDDYNMIKEYYLNNTLDKSDLLKTLYTKYEAEYASLYDLIVKQILHYISGGYYGVQEVAVNKEKFNFDIIKIVNKETLKNLIENDIYGNNALDCEKVKAINELITKYKFTFDYSKIKNNEVKVFYILSGDTITGVSGDDVLRAIIYLFTEKTLLIKDIKTLEQLMLKNDNIGFVSILLKMYREELSECFNRHKKIFMALKRNNGINRNFINIIGKLSKKNHKPIIPALNKIFVREYITLMESIGIKTIEPACKQDLDKLTTKDKMTLLYHVENLMSSLPYRVYKIRNGKVWYTEHNSNFRQDIYKGLHTIIKASLVEDLKYLEGMNINYPKDVDYGLPISEKQSCSHYPFFTKFLNTSNDMLVCGMYWENEWGARDLDLSSVIIDGSRKGWGQIDTYENDDILFSGDITNAQNGAIEYIISKNDKDSILINNIFNGSSDYTAKFKIVIGKTKKVKKNYIEDIAYELDMSFDGKRAVSLGAMNKDRFILFPIKLNNNQVSSPSDMSLLPYTIVKHTNMKELLELAGCVFADKDVDIDLSTNNITFDKLRKLFEK